MNKQASNRDALRVEDWSGEMGDRWLRHLDTFESMIAGAGDALLQRAAYKPGEKVVDIGCGGGASSRAIAQQVAPAGYVVGVDISAQLVDEATRRAEKAGLSNARYIAGDATTVKLIDAPFDRLHSRFGSMFFADPPAAFANLAKMLRSGGRADFVVWAPAKDNPWVAGLMRVLTRYIDMPKPEPRAPGPFSLDDPEYFGGLLRDAGFDSLDFHQWRGLQWVGGKGATADSALEFLLKGMSFGDIALEQPEPIQLKIKQELREYFATHESAEGVALEALAWLVSAERR